MPEKKSGKSKAKKPRANVADLELNPPNEESGEQKTGPKGGTVANYKFTQAWPTK